jgi:hypothetical protein
VLLPPLQGTRCEVFVLDKEGPPPGADESQRLVVLVGEPAQVRAASSEIDLLLSNQSYRPGRRLARGRLGDSLMESAERAASRLASSSSSSTAADHAAALSSTSGDSLLEAPACPSLPSYQLVEPNLTPTPTLTLTPTLT